MLCDRPDYYHEIFCGSDDGDPDALYWLLAEGRSEAEAVRIVKDFVGDEEEMVAGPVVGYVEQTPEGPWFHKSPAGEERFWEVSSR